MPDLVAGKLLDDCFLHDKDRLRHDEAIAILRERLQPIAGSNVISIAEAVGRILNEDVKAPRPVPGYDNAAVDGYAFRHQDFEKNDGFFEISDRVAAGDINPTPIKATTAVRIFTGAPVPPGADTIAMQEDCKTSPPRLTVAIPPGLKRNANLRKAGEDLKAGDVISQAGSRLRAQEISALASIGLSKVSVFDRLNIALISTGNEIVRPESDLEVGQVYDSNHYLLRSLLQPMPVNALDEGIIEDQAAAVEHSILRAAEKSDVVITTGGASRGEEDHVVNTLLKHGKCHLWQLAIKPGRPMLFGQIGKTVFFGLPGNPVASFVCFLLYVRPSLLRLAGSDWETPEKFPMPVNFDIANKKPDRREFWRGRIQEDQNGTKRLSKFERDGSGLISGLRLADGLIEVPEEITSVSVGDKLNFIAFSQFY